MPLHDEVGIKRQPMDATDKKHLKKSKSISKIPIASDEAPTITNKNVPNQKPLKDSFAETLPVDKAKAQKYHRYENPINDFRASKSKKYRHEIKRSDTIRRKAGKFAARTEVLLREEEGFIEADPFENEFTYQVSQQEIVKSVDITTATKHFDLNLMHGPYSVDYFRSGRNLLLGGQRGHVAAIDWITKDLMCEFNVQESVHAVKWLHVPEMFAVAQKDWVHVYDSRGTEVHCLKKLYRVRAMEFLPYHFLLVTQSDNGFLSWTDTSVGRIIATNRSKKCPRFTDMCQNSSNAIIHTAHPNGVVNLWSPNMPEPAMSVLCHGCPVRGVSVDDQGRTMATVATNGELKLWDVRKTYEPLYRYNLRNSPSGLTFSQRGLLAVTTGNIVQVFKDLASADVGEQTRRPAPYLIHKVHGRHIISSAQFVNFEDVLGVGHAGGFVSCLVPGASEPNFDSFEANPYQSVSQRREMEVKQLLEKIQPELISLDPTSLAAVNKKEVRRLMEAKEKILHVKTPDIEMGTENDPRKRKSKKMKSAGIKGAKAKDVMRDKKTRAASKNTINMKKQIAEREESKVAPVEDAAALAVKDALDRFRKKSINPRYTKHRS